jgi:hypothetical protein
MIAHLVIWRVQRFFYRRSLKHKLNHLRSRLTELGLDDSDMKSALDKIEQMTGLK